MPFSQQILRVMDYILVTASIVKILNSSLIDANKVNFLHSSWSSSKCIQVKSEVDTDCITAFELEFKQQTFFFPRISFDHIPCSSLRRNEIALYSYERIYLQELSFCMLQSTHLPLCLWLWLSLKPKAELWKRFRQRIILHETSLEFFFLRDYLHFGRCIFFKA